MKHPIGILGGTFDPIHYGHTKIAEDLIRVLELQEMLFIPNREPHYREKPIANAKHRLAMVRIATAKNPKFIVNDIEIQRPGPTYSIDTITTLRERIPNQPLCLILGADVFSRMNQWYNWESIPSDVHLVIINRSNTVLPSQPWIQTLLKEREINDSKKLQTKPGGYILRYEIDPLPISATDIRKKLSAGEDVSQQIDPDVLRYIQQHHLYL